MNKAFLLQELTDKAVQHMGESPKFRKTVYAHAARSREVLESLRARLGDSTDLDAQKTALQTLHMMGSAAMTTEILAALRDLLVSSNVLRGDIVRLIAEVGVDAVESAGMIEALFRISGDESVETRRWCVVALSCVARENLTVRKRLADIAIVDTNENVKLEAEAALVESSALYASLLNSLRDSKTAFAHLLNLLAMDPRTVFESLYLPVVSANPKPVRFGSSQSLSATRSGKSGDYEWSLVHNRNDSYTLLLDFNQTGKEGQIVEVRELEPISTPIGFIILRESGVGLSSGELAFTRILPDQPKWLFHLHDWRTIPEEDLCNLQEFYESVLKGMPSEDTSHWEKWLQMASERLYSDEDLE